MISYLKGTVHAISGMQVTLDVQGVGYDVLCTANCVNSLDMGASAALVVVTEMRESSIALYGFANPREKEVFVLLTKVKGVGARSALDILSCMDSHDLLRCIGASDVQRLQTIKGIGKKTAERIVVELRDQVAEYVNGQVRSALVIDCVSTAPVHEAQEALVALGFARRDAERALAKIDGSVLAAKDSGEIVKVALQYI